MFLNLNINIKHSCYPKRSKINGLMIRHLPDYYVIMLIRRLCNSVNVLFERKREIGVNAFSFRHGHLTGCLLISVKPKHCKNETTKLYVKIENNF